MSRHVSQPTCRYFWGKATWNCYYPSCLSILDICSLNCVSKVGSKKFKASRALASQALLPLHLWMKVFWCMSQNGYAIITDEKNWDDAILQGPLSMRNVLSYKWDLQCARYIIQLIGIFIHGIQSTLYIWWCRISTRLTNLHAGSKMLQTNQGRTSTVGKTWGGCLLSRSFETQVYLVKEHRVHMGHP